MTRFDLIYEVENSKYREIYYKGEKALDLESGKKLVLHKRNHKWNGEIYIDCFLLDEEYNCIEGGIEIKEIIDKDIIYYKVV